MIRRQLARIKRKLRSKPYTKDKRYPAYWFNEMLGGSEAFLVQIGSNDGKTGDPLYPLFQKNKQWKGLLVEPIPYFFEKLQANYSNTTRFQLENVAINEGRKMTFYWVDQKAKINFPDLPFWFEQLGSFDKNHILKELGDKIQPYIQESDLEGITVDELLNRNEVSKIDILHIDAEGYDWKILSQFDLKRYCPKFILFEFHHLDDIELNNTLIFLAN
ncbi:MAG: FkbM family methyltransferase [Bacteroidota bacterium]